MNILQKNIIYKRNLFFMAYFSLLKEVIFWKTLQTCDLEIIVEKFVVIRFFLIDFVALFFITLQTGLRWWIGFCLWPNADI